jgi:iron complex outermembrane receptor protein
MCAVLGSLLCAQQKSATLRGVVTDPSGQVISGAAVTVKAVQGSISVTAVSNRDGEYAVASLPEGGYQISGKAPGFQQFETSGVRLTAGQATSLDIRLEISPVQSQITVVSRAPSLEGEKETQLKNHQEVLEIREVRESSSKDVGEALARLDGLWKVRRGGIGNDIVLRGFQQDNINVLIDGARIHGACPNNMDPPGFHVDFAEVQHVDILKGPFDMKNQGSLGGTVNVVSKDPESGFQVTPTFATGSFGYLNPSAVMSYSNGRRFVAVGHSARRSDPYQDGSGQPFTQRANYNQAGMDQRAFDINTSWLRAGGELRKNHHAGVSYTRQRGGLVLYPYLMMDAPFDRADLINGHYAIDGLGDTVRTLTMRGYYTQVDHWMTDELRVSSAGAPRAFSMATQANTTSLGGRIEAASSSGLVWGVEAYRRNWNALNTMRLAGQYTDQPMIPDVATTSLGVYSEYRRTFATRLTVSAGGRLDTGRSEARSGILNPDLYWAYKGTRELSRRDTYPSGGIWANYRLRERLELFSGVGRTVRLPDAQERYSALRRMGSDWVGNPNLAPTRNTEIDLGVNYRGEKFTLRPTLFYSDLSDYIVVHNQAKLNPVMFVMNSMARSYAAVPARIYGGEMGYSVSPHRSLLLSGGVSYSRGAKDTRPAMNILTSNMAEMPPLRSRASLRYGNRLFFVEFENVSTLAQDKVDTDLKEQPTPGYTVWNLKAGIHTNKLKVAAGVDNLANRFYYESFSYQRDPFRFGAKIPEPGRSLFLTVCYVF